MPNIIKMISEMLASIMFSSSVFSLSTLPSPAAGPLVHLSSGEKEASLLVSSESAVVQKREKVKKKQGIF